MGLKRNNHEIFSEEELKERFDVFDLDKNGCISPDELKQVIHEFAPSIPDSKIMEVLERADKNDDGNVNYNEFITLLKELENRKV